MRRTPSLLALFSILLLTGQGCFGGGGGSTGATLEPVELDIWGVFDNRDAYDTLRESYRTLHPNVTINYRELRFEEYKDELVTAFAEDTAPDIFMVHNTNMGQFQNLMMPMPETVTITTQEQRGTVRRELVTITTETRTPSQRDIMSRFVAQVPEDVIRSYQPDPKLDAEERVFGFPLSFDTLALFYNTDMLDAAGIATPPADWTAFQQAVIAMTTYDDEGEVLQSAAAMGEGENVERSTDILSLLMMQNGTEMTDDRGRVTFHLVPEAFEDDEIVPGLDATVFYTDFANPTKQVYTWNDSYPSSFEAFANGDTAFFFGYSYHVPLLRTVAPKLNFETAPVPQITGSTQEANVANYWVHTVSKDTEFPDWAWDFLVFASSEEQVLPYLNETQRPTALRNLIDEQLGDENLAVFAEQILTARSWYQGVDAEAAEQALKDLIDVVLTNPEDPLDALEEAARKVGQTY